VGRACGGGVPGITSPWRRADPGGRWWYPDPATRCGAVATQDGTLVLAVGGRAGSHPPSTWEPRFAAEGPAARGEWDAAAALVHGVLAEHPDDARAHFDLARFLARGGDADAAASHLARAHEMLPDTVARAMDEDDLAGVRDRVRPGRTDGA
jgi:hypothetical protein